MAEHDARPWGRRENERLGRTVESDREQQRLRTDRKRAEAARQRSRRPRAEVYVNEFNGTTSWRLRDVPARRRHTGTSQRPGENRSRSGSPAHSPAARAAALRSAGLNPAGGDRGAAPTPTHSATVLAASRAPVDRMTPGELSGHLNRVGALRSQLSGDLARSGRMPVTAAARLRTGVSQARVHSLTQEKSLTFQELAARHRPPAHLQPSVPGRSR